MKKGFPHMSSYQPTSTASLSQHSPELLTRHRLVNWWIKWQDLNYPNADTLDSIRRRAEKIAQASVTAVILFGAHFRWDYLPYFTILHDYIAAVAEELHKYGIKLYDRHSVNLVHRYDTREEMRHVMLHSGPHLPFSPSREAAASWEYKGKRLNDWRMIDVRDRSVLYYPQYAAEGFCYRNPEFLDAYTDYAGRLVSDTGIDGISAEDPVHYMHYISCACPHCRAELKRRTGMDLPPIDDRGFWGNWDSPAWREWIDLRYEAGKEFFEHLRPALPAEFRITTCGANSASPSSNGKASDARKFLAGSNYVNSEMSGNTPPYKHDPVTVNFAISDRVIGASHHLAAARERGVRCFTTGYGFTEPSANIIWAVNKIMDLDCCFSTLKARLGLPDHMLDALPTEADVIGKAFGFEKAHPALFEGTQIGQLGVYFSYETRNHTYFGNLDKGYYKDYSKTLQCLFRAGISAHTVFRFPENAEEYPLIVLSSAAKMTDGEIRALRTYLSAGGKVIVTGPTPLSCCQNTWKLPASPTLDDPKSFFSTIANGVYHRAAEWITKTELPPSTDDPKWQNPEEGLYYSPARVSDGTVTDEFLALCRRFMKPMPIRVLSSEGYLISVFEGKDHLLVHLLAEDFDTDIDHHLDEIRFHRSRVNYVNKADPIGICDTLTLASDTVPTVYTPFSDMPSAVSLSDGVVTVTLPEKTAYAILQFPKRAE